MNSSHLLFNNAPSVFHVLNVLFHLSAGLFLLVLAPPLARKMLFRPTRIEKAAGISLGLASMSGLVLIVMGAARPFRWLLQTHVALSIAGVSPLLTCIVARRHRRWRPLFACSIAALLIPFLASRLSDTNNFSISNSTTVPLPMEE